MPNEGGSKTHVFNNENGYTVSYLHIADLLGNALTMELELSALYNCQCLLQIFIYKVT